MNPRLLPVIRTVQGLLYGLALLVVLLILAASGAFYLAITGNSLPLLRMLATQVGQLAAGQRTEAITLNVRILPERRRLEGTASLTVRSLEENRRRFYFLLNEGLHVREARVAAAGGEAHPVPVYQLAVLTIVDVEASVPKGSTVQLTFAYEGAPAAGRFSMGAVVDPQQVLLNVDTFWYPSDVQGFFTADVTVTAPRRLTVVHNGVQALRRERGDLQEIRWTSARPLAGLALVAGAYDLTTIEKDGIRYRVYLPPDVTLDAKRVLTLMSDAQHALDESYGSSGFRQLTMLVSRDIRRAFNDGSGLMGASLRYFRTGDYGFAVIAHEIAHNWWGATVAPKWLSPGTGGQWLVEGFAEFSSLVAAEAVYGTEALTRRLAGEFFDPARQTALVDMSVLDNVLREETARDTIYRKGAYVAFMLRTLLGDTTYFGGLRQFLDKYRYQQASDTDLQKVLQEVSEQPLERYFADWVRSDRLADLSLDDNGQGAVVVHNLGGASVDGAIGLWTFKKTDAPPTRSTVHVGDTIHLDAETDHAVLDPLLAWADVQRLNNRYPRRRDPVYVSQSSTALAVTVGESFPWVAATVINLPIGGGTRPTWEFERGMADPPMWSPDGSRLIVSYSQAADPLPAIVTLATDGTRRSVGNGSAPAAAADGSIYAAAQDRVLRLAGDGLETTVVRRPGASLGLPLPSPDGSRFAYTAARDDHLQVHEFGRGDRVLLSWDRDRMLYRWAPDGSRLYAVVGGAWDWQVWDVPVGAEAVQVLASGAALLTDLAVSPDGTRLAFTAAPTLDYPINRRQLFVLSLGDRTVRNVDVPDADLSQLTWLDANALGVVATTVAQDRPWILPAERSLQRINLADGSIEDLMPLPAESPSGK